MYRSLALFSAFLLSSAALAGEKLNVLWIVSDDLGPELGCYGYEGVETPNLDRLAAGGTRYTRAFSSSPVCSSSRSAFVTGRYQWTIASHHHRTRKVKALPDPVRPVMEYFREEGAFVSCGSMRAGVLKTRGKMDYNFEHDTKTAFDGTDWRQREEGQAFFAQVQIHEPHRPFVKSGRSGEGLAIPPFYPDHPVARADWANYLASIEVLDEKVGVILDRLEEDGLAESTAVIFFGDHGRPHMRGKQWLYEGGLHIPLIVRVPGQEGGVVEDRLVSAIDLVPATLTLAGIEVPEQLHGRDFLGADSTPREIVFAGRDRCGDAPDRIRALRTERFKYIRNYEPGRSYSQLSGYKKLSYPVVTLMAVMHGQGRLAGPQAEWFAESRPEEELYDLEADPWEMNNLATNPEEAGRLAGFRAQLAEQLAATGDDAAEPEGDADYLAELMAGKRAYYEKAMRKRKLDPGISDRDYLEWWKGELGVK